MLNTSVTLPEQNAKSANNKMLVCVYVHGQTVGNIV